MNRNIELTAALAIVAIALMAAPAAAAVASVVEADGWSWIRSDDPDNFGTGTRIGATGTLSAEDALRTIMSFDLTGHTGFTIDPASQLTLHVDRDDHDTTAGLQTLELYLLPQDFRNGADGGASWNKSDEGVAWPTPGAIQAGDTPLATTDIDMGGSIAGLDLVFASSDLNVAIQNAIDAGERLNLGLKAPGLEYDAFGPRAIVWTQGPTGENPATLVIPEPATLGLLGLGGLGMLL
ncbi:MAG: hypothetical protein ACP5HU_13600, partial [Phycisphaerae bacterium]